MPLLELIKSIILLPQSISELVGAIRDLRGEIKSSNDAKWAKDASQLREEFEKAETTDQKINLLRRLSGLQRDI